MISLLVPGMAWASEKTDYDEAYKIYIAAGISVAAYSDRIGTLASRYLEAEGWEIDRYGQTQGQDGARFVVARKDLGTASETYILAFVGTENADDVKCDLKVDKVYFAGSSIAELTANAAQKGLNEQVPKVHRGFYEFVQSGLMAQAVGTDGTAHFISEILLANKNSKILLVGHSLGGAAATITGAALLNLGVGPEQIEVITFGAPAVGNAAFAAKYEPVLNLTRIVIEGDPVTGVLQTLVGGYRQFGREIRWHLPFTTDRPHHIAEYVDLALKNYYDKRQRFREATMHIPALPENTAEPRLISVAPLQNTLPDDLQYEFWYMQEALRDEYDSQFSVYRMTGQGRTQSWLEDARQAGSQWLVVPEVQVTRLKQARYTYYITVSQTVYDVKSGEVAQLAVFSTGTYQLTPLEAFIHSLKGLSGQAWELHH